MVVIVVVTSLVSIHNFHDVDSIRFDSVLHLNSAHCITDTRW